MNKEIVNKIVESYTGEKTDPNAVYELLWADLQDEERYPVPSDVVPPYFIYYLKCLNVDTVINQYFGHERYNRDGTVQDFYRYTVDFCHNGKKVDIVNRNTVFFDLYEGSPVTRRIDSRNIIFDTESNRITCFDPDWKEKWTIYYETESSNYLRMELLLNREPKRGKRIALATDKIGNIEIYIDENARDFRRNHARKSGIKYTINIGKEHCDVNKYIDAIVSVINQDNLEEAKLFEMIIRDPRVKEWLNAALMRMPKSLDELYTKLKQEMEDEYNTRLAELNETIDKSQKGRHL